jgi:prophage regulatory protein
MLTTAAGSVSGKTERLMRRKAVEHMTGLSKPTIYRRIANGTFPKPIHYAGNLNLWLESEIQNWIAALIQNRDADAA